MENLKMGDNFQNVEFYFDNQTMENNEKMVNFRMGDNFQNVQFQSKSPSTNFSKRTTALSIYLPPFTGCFSSLGPPSKF